MKDESPPKNDVISEKPPIFNSWKWWYITVLLNLIGLILFFYLITKIFT